jgi:protein-S-isoprenylcysteine O-methyltransferase Ste14
MLVLRALLAFLLLPGVVAGLAPYLLRPADRPFQPSGLCLALPGVAVLLWSVRDFYVAGRGTLAPWSPPDRLVEVGLYRVSRNPMYVGVALVLTGWALAYRSGLLAAYALAVVLAFTLRVIRVEEPTLARRFGTRYADYRARVGRWL